MPPNCLAESLDCLLKKVPILASLPYFSALKHYCTKRIIFSKINLYCLSCLACLRCVPAPTHLIQTTGLSSCLVTSRSFESGVSKTCGGKRLGDFSWFRMTGTLQCVFVTSLWAARHDQDMMLVANVVSSTPRWWMSESHDVCCVNYRHDSRVLSAEFGTDVPNDLSLCFSYLSQSSSFYNLPHISLQSPVSVTDSGNCLAISFLLLWLAWGCNSAKFSKNVVVIRTAGGEAMWNATEFGI